MPSRAAHIALNAQLLAGGASYRSAGIHQYIAHLLQHLPAADPALRYTVFVGDGQPEMPGAHVWRAAWSTTRPLLRILWEQTALPLALARTRPDVLHALAFVSPFIPLCPTVITVYDLSFRLMPERFLPAQRLYLSAFTAYSCRRARQVLAISHSTRADVVRLLGVPAEKVTVAPPGVQPTLRPLPRVSVEAFRAQRGLPERFILYLGTLEPRKNLDTLIRAFAQLKATDSNLKLVLAGATGWRYTALFKLVEDLQLTADVFFPGYVPAEELALWYNTAAVFAYPSSYEGFGMPVVEALACGRPVVTSNVSALPEAAGAVAWQVAPTDVNALADALRRALTSDEDWQTRGPAHAAHFTWATTAARTVAAYHHARA